jgi:hypothetical protein
MNNKIGICIFLMILISSCGTPPSATNTNVASPQPSEVPIVSTSTPKFVTKSAIEVLKPNIEKICPSAPEVSVDRLELPNNLVLLAVNDDEGLGGDLGSPLHSDVLSFSNLSLAPVKIDKIRSFDNTSTIINILMSPNGKLLAIFRWDAQNSHETLWISTWDGQNQRMVIDIAPKQRVSWVNDHEIVVVGVPDEAHYESFIPEEKMRPLLSINLLTSETRHLEPLPENGIYIYNSYHSKDGNPYSLYYKDDGQKRTYFLYNYVKGISTQVFRWANTDPTTGVGVRSNELYYVVHRVEGGADFAVDLTIEQIAEDKNYNDVMKRLLLGGNQNLLISTMFDWATVEIPILTSDPVDDQKPSPIYLYDYKNNVLKDYCINLGRTFGTLSPDEQFAAFTVDEGKDIPSYHILLLNLKTGFYSIIKDTKAIGFGITQ